MIIARGPFIGGDKPIKTMEEWGKEMLRQLEENGSKERLGLPDGLVLQRNMTKYTCTCSMQTIMATGCKCGGI